MTKLTTYEYRQRRTPRTSDRWRWLFWTMFVAFITTCVLTGSYRGQMHTNEQESAHWQAQNQEHAMRLNFANAYLASERIRYAAEVRAMGQEIKALREDNAALAEELSQSTTTKSTPKPSRSGDGWRTDEASWYGSAFYGNLCADNKTVYGPKTWGVAHKTLAFGTVLEIEYNGKAVSVPVLDRGPYAGDRVLDLSYAVAQALGFEGVQTVKWRVK